MPVQLDNGSIFADTPLIPFASIKIMHGAEVGMTPGTRDVLVQIASSPALPFRMRIGAWQRLPEHAELLRDIVQDTDGMLQAVRAYLDATDESEGDYLLILLKDIVYPPAGMQVTDFLRMEGTGG